MPSATVPLHHLADRISQQEAELSRLRKEFQARRTKLADLTRRKMKLQSQLQKVEAAMKAVGELHDRSAAGAATAKPAAKPVNGVSLPKFLVGLVLEAKRPITIKELSQEVVRRDFPTTSKNISAMVETRVSELLRKGLLQRTRDKSGIIATGMSSAAAKETGAAAKSISRKPVSAPRMAKVMTASPGTRLSLKESLTRVLAKSSRPLTTDELAQKILATGYETKSKNFKNVIWVGIGNMDNVEHVQGQGYRLKKGQPKR